MRTLEDEGSGTFADFQKAAVTACKDYPAKDKLVASMPSRIQEVIEKKGGAINR